MHEKQIYIKPWYSKWFRANAETAAEFCRRTMDGMTCTNDEKRRRIEKYHLKGIALDELLRIHKDGQATSPLQEADKERGENSMKEIEVYAVHFTQQNPLQKVMNETVVETIKRLGGAMVPCKDENLYLGSFVFHTPELRDEFCRWCDDFGIYFTVEKENAYIPAELAPAEWQNGERR